MMKRIKIIKNKVRGFTLIELLVASAMIVLITTISLINYRNGEKSKRVQLSADGVINTIRMAQNYTLSGKEIDPAIAPLCNLGNSAVYYFVEFRHANTSYLLKARDKCGNDKLVGQYQLTDKTRIKPTTGLKLGAASANTSLAVQFLLPFAKIQGSIDGSAYSFFQTEDIILETTDSSRSKTIVIDGISGRIGE